MTTRIVLSVLIAALMTEISGLAQTTPQQPVADRYVDRVNGLSLEQAVARALDQEPSLRAARSEIDVAGGMRHQASLRPNPSVSFERRVSCAPGMMATDFGAMRRINSSSWRLIIKNFS